MTSAPDDWDRIKSLFQRALDEPPADRERFVTEHTADALAIRADVLAMLTAHGDTSDLLEGHAHERLGLNPDADPALPAAIGPFRPTARIGRGGMGVVYRAERNIDGGTQTVALKLIAAGLADPETIRRFERERSILARLQHPNIAHFIDGGFTPDGSPWFAMQLVEDGDDLIHWCDQRQLPPKARIALFLQALDAVGFAHRHLVVHRDLKPGNLMVDRSGAVKLLDFGIAKLIDDVADAGLTRTIAPMTPEYAAPEQLLGDLITTATDIHALGVVLFELLCGRLPYALTHGRAIAAAICDHDPIRMRDALSRPPESQGRRNLAATAIAAQRATDLAELRRTLDRDLELIVATAIARAPGDRYASVEAFADDLRAWLDDRPLRSRPVPWPQRFGKFLRRHRAAAIAAITMLAIAVIGVAATLWQAQRASVQAERAQAARRVLSELFLAADPVTLDGKPLSARDLVDQGARTLQHDASLDPDLRASLLTDLANVQLSLGEAKRARELLATIGGGSDLTEETRIAWLLLRADAEIDDGDYPAAERTLADAAPLLDDLPDRDHRRIRHEQTQAQLDLRLQRHDAAATRMNRLLDTLPSDDAYAIARGDAHGLLGQIAHDRRDFAAALNEADASIADYRRGGAPPAQLASAYSERARTLGQSARFDEAISAFRDVIARHTAVYGADHPLTLSTQGEWANLLRQVNRFDEADALFLDVIARKRRTLGNDHPDLAIALINYGIMRYQRDEFAAALPYFEASHRIWRKTLGETNDRTLVALDALAGTHAELGDTERAIAEIASLVALREAGGDSDTLASSLTTYGVILDRAGRLPESCAKFRDAIAMSERLYPDNAGNTRWPHALLGRCLRRLGRHTDAERELRDARASFLAWTPDPGPRVAMIDIELARTLRAGGGDRTEITTLYDEAVRLREKKLNPGHPKIDEAIRERESFRQGKPLPEGI